MMARFEYRVFGVFGMMSVLYNKLFVGAGGLDVNLADVKKGVQYARDVDLYILYVVYFERCHISGEKSAHLKINDAFVGYHPNIQKIIGPRDESADPQENNPDRI